MLVKFSNIAFFDLVCNTGGDPLRVVVQGGLGPPLTREVSDIGWAPPTLRKAIFATSEFRER